MSNLLEYTLSLNDSMSAKLKKIGVNSGAALDVFARLEGQSKEVDRVMRGTGNAVGALRQKLEHLKSERDWIPTSNIKSIRRYNTEIQKLEQRVRRFETISGSRTKRYFREAFGQIPFANLITNPLVIAGAVGAKAIKVGIEEEMQKTSFNVLLGGEAAGEQFFKEVKEYAKNTPFRKLGVGDAAKTMLGFGIELEKVMPTLRAIGDIAGGNQERMKSLALAYSQMSSTGKLMGQDLNQMINAGFNPLDQISKQTGKSIGQLREDMSKGLVTTSMVENAFITVTQEGGKFHNMAQKMSRTLGGRASTVMDNFTDKFIAIYGAISPVAMLLLDLANYTLTAVSSGVSYLNDKLKEGHPVMMVIAGTLFTVAAAMGVVKIASMSMSAWTTIQFYALELQTAAWWQLNAAMLANPTVWIVAGIIAAIAAIGYLVYRVDGWGQMWDHTMKGMKAVWSGYVSYVKIAWLGLEHLLLSGIESIMIGWYKLQGLWNADEANAGLEKIKKQSEARKKAIVDEGKEIIKQGKSALDHFKQAGASLSFNDKNLGDLKNDLSAKLGISAPTIGGKTLTTNLSNNKNTQNSESNSKAVTGGRKNTTINIKLNDLIGVLNIENKGFKESVSQMEDQTTDALLRVLGLAATASS
ncbi:tape measure domain-containing protein [Wenyingzhuangia heitensis]|uniref:Tape measure domain-containing protein n=2 Tax=Wenyingzhuangia heitensis TaxID=1487859 RepID=A0ABX0UDC2_9FLAO|nr:tape measure domain-containing protein [Wenyingzhuangia heitensis]